MTVTEQLYFEDFVPGRVFEGQTRTLGEEEFRMFAAITGDAHPIHYDPEYAALPGEAAPMPGRAHDLPERLVRDGVIWRPCSRGEG